MKATVDRRAFAAALKTVTPALAKASSSPALLGVRITPERGQLQLTCTNLDLTISHVVDADCDAGDQVIVPAIVLARVLAPMSGEVVELVADDDIVTITSDGARAELRCVPVDSWPQVDEVAWGESQPVELTANDIHLLGSIAYAAAPAGGIVKKACLTAIHFTGCSVEASDASRAGVATLSTAMPEMLVPGHVVTAVLSSKPDHLTVRATKTMASLAALRTTWMTRLVDAEPIAISKIVPGDDGPSVSIQADDLRAALAMMNTFGEPEGVDGATRVTVVDGVATFRRIAPDVGEVEDQCVCVGDLPYGIGLNGMSLGQLVDHVEADDIELRFGASQITPLKVVDGDAVHVLMPVRMTAIGKSDAPKAKRR